MAKPVGVFGVGHNPVTPGFLGNTRTARLEVKALQARYADTREQLAAVRPDVVLAVCSDHLNRWSTVNMPARRRRSSGSRWP